MKRLNTIAHCELNNRSNYSIQDNTRPLKHFKTIHNKKFGFSLDTMTDDEGTVWFVLDDVCYYLGLSTFKNTKDSLKEAHTCVVISDKVKGGKPVSLVSEIGVYHLALRSRKPSADRFYEWVFGEALSSIRKAAFNTLRAQINELIEELREAAKLLQACHKERFELYHDIDELISWKFGIDYVC
ncbi:MAG: hypothetical protein J0G29_02170 [Alphaproteobacteria bacterium]|nr:hypothetical protein [Alphaproteobacteria bacterium]OJV45205.1 MAG: hypothetical protein BGO28_00170 [Alphaproteobacteria bacterium 43-37]